MAGNAGGPKAYWAKLTPEQRSKEMKRRMRIAKANKTKTRREAKAHGRVVAAANGHSAPTLNGDSFDHLAYVYGKTEAFIEFYAASHQLPTAALATGIARLLQHKARR